MGTSCGGLDWTWWDQWDSAIPMHWSPASRSRGTEMPAPCAPGRREGVEALLGPLLGALDGVSLHASGCRLRAWRVFPLCCGRGGAVPPAASSLIHDPVAQQRLLQGSWLPVDAGYGGHPPCAFLCACVAG